MINIFYSYLVSLFIFFDYFKPIINIYPAYSNSVYFFNMFRFYMHVIRNNHNILIKSVKFLLLSNHISSIVIDIISQIVNKFV